MSDESEYREFLSKNTNRLARRQAIATSAMNGILAESDPSVELTPSQIAKLSVECADALIAELDK